MPTIRSADKRREILRRQLYGKEVFAPKNSSTTPAISRVFTYQPQNSPAETSSSTVLTEISYLRKDLFKILILSLAAVLFQVLLFIASQNGLIHLRLGW